MRRARLLDEIEFGGEGNIKSVVFKRITSY